MHHWKLDERGRATNEIIDGRRPSSLLVTTVPDAQVKPDDDDTTSERINALRSLVDLWRKSGWKGVTQATRSLLEYWTLEDRVIRLYWAQIEALETLIWLHEIAPRTGEGSEIIKEIVKSNKENNDSLQRISSKMATGTGKTVVMAMIIAWHTCNYRKDPTRFGNQFVVVTPGLIIRDRLQELLPRGRDNVYDRMDLLPLNMRQSIKDAHVRIVNYQSFSNRDTFTQLGASAHEKRLLRSRNPDPSREDNLVMLDRVLIDLDLQHNVVVINDEAHHCYKPGTGRLRAENKDDRNRAALWFNAVKLIDRSFSCLLNIYDLSATPKFIERGEGRLDSLFPWTVSDFPITDAIESGMVKIPRVPVGHTGLESEACRRVFENTEPHYRKQLEPQKMPPTVIAPLDTLYKLYEEKFNLYAELEYKIPPVFIIVADSIHNARAFYEYVAGMPAKNNNSDIEDSWSNGHYELFSNNPRHGNGLRTILVHSRIDEDEHFDEMKDIIRGEASRLSSIDPRKTDTEIVRDVLATVGKEGMPGEQIRCVISVSMLTEGWDAKNVTHVFGYRKFGTQLLCEQVSGRALRRSDVDSSSEWYKNPVYAEIFGVPFDYMVDTPIITPPINPVPKVYVFPKDQSEELVIEFPLVEGYSHYVSPNATVTLDPSKVRDYVISLPVGDPSGITLKGPMGETKTIDPLSISLQAAKFRLAKIAVEEWLRPKNVQNDNIYNNISLFAQMRRNVDAWLYSPKIVKETGFKPHWLILEPHVSAIPRAIVSTCDITTHGTPVRQRAIFSSSSPASTTAIRFDTAVIPERVYESPAKCQHNCAPCDSKLEVCVARLLDKLDIVLAWTRNHNTRFGWSIPYYFQGRWQNYYPDFVARLKPTPSDNGYLHTVIEVKGVSDERSLIKAEYARDIWVKAAQDAGFGRWEYVYITDIEKAAWQLELARGGSK